MKILVPGKALSNRQRWEGFLIKCSKCGCEFQLEPGDAVASFSEYVRDGAKVPKHCEVVCPTAGCVSIIWFSEPEEYVTDPDKQQSLPLGTFVKSDI